MSTDKKSPATTSFSLPDVSPELQHQYEQLLSGLRVFGKATAAGIEIAGTVHPSLTGRIASWRLYLYRWAEGQQKQEYPIEGTPDSQITTLGLKHGVGFTFEANDFFEPISFDCTFPSYLGFSSYAATLVARGLTLETVITKLSTARKVFKTGLATVLVFRLLKSCGEVDAVDAESTPKPSAQTAAAGSIPSAWQ